MDDSGAATKRSGLPRTPGGLLGLIVYLTALACTGAPGAKDSNWVGYAESGKASYYAAKFQSRKTASGEPFDRSKKTAAHRKLPFGTKIRVTDTGKSKSVTVRVNDRGPFVKGRIVDLSASAFSQIADLHAGIIDVSIEVVE